MYRNSYNTGNSFSLTSQSRVRGTSTSGFGVRSPLYPIGPTIPQPQYQHIQRGFSPSPYLNKNNLRPPSYETRYLGQSDGFTMHEPSINYEDRQRRLIDRNEKQIDEEERRREQIRISYEREIKSLAAKINRNIEKKQTLLSQFQALSKSNTELSEKLSALRPPEKDSSSYEPLDRKQQQMIILKNRLVNSMRQNETQLNSKEEEQEKMWEEQIGEKERILFQLQQNLRDKRLELHAEKQKELELPDFLSIEEEVRSLHYNQFIQNYQHLTRRLKTLTDQRQVLTKQICDAVQLKKPQFHNLNIKREEVKKQFYNVQIRVEELDRVSEQMEIANQNLLKQLERKEEMITKYESDIYDLKSKKEQVESSLAEKMNAARNRDSSSLSKSLNQIFTQIHEDIRTQQGKGSKLKNAYQKLFELLSSAISKDIHQTFNESIAV